MSPKTRAWRATMAGSLLACLTACGGTRAIIVPVGDPVILAQPVQARVFVRAKDGGWIETDKPATIPAGWACWYLDRKDLAP